MPALTPAHGAMLAESGAVCLESQGHARPARLTIEQSRRRDVCNLLFPKVTEQMSRSYGDEENATEWGATAVALLVMRHLTGFVAVQRVPKGDGFDYWIGDDSGDDDQPLAGKVKLEVSGIRRGSAAAVKARARAKLKRHTLRHDPTRPAHVVVVEFSQPLAHVVKR